MFAEFLITLREGFEAALIVSIMLAYLTKTGRRLLSRHVWRGTGLAIMASLTLGGFSWLTYGVLPEAAKTLFEGVAAWLAVIVLSSMIYWMASKGRGIKAHVEQRVEAITSRGAALGLAAFAFVVVFREGVETVLFILPFLVRSPLTSSVGSFVGAIIAVALAYAIFVVGMKLNLRGFFYFTSILLVLLAGGLAGYGTHELLEYSEHVGLNLGWYAQTAFSLPIPQDSLLHHKNIIGSILAVMLGYTVKAEWGRVIIQGTYLMIAVPLVVRVYRRKQ